MSELKAKKLKMVYEIGQGDSSKKATKTYTNLKAEANDEGLAKVAGEIKNLQTRPLIEAVKVDEVKLDLEPEA